MALSTAFHVPRPGDEFTAIERDVRRPGPGTVLLRVEACGICHGDMVTKEGHWPGIQYPRVPGHEVAGVVEETGAGVENWKAGDRAGIGWCGDYCGVCTPCRRGDFMSCVNQKITGLSFDGGYAQYMIAPARGLARIPDALSPAEAAPLLCAGITTFNALRHSGAQPGDLVAVQGIGGLGHMAVQYARAFGHQVVAISSGADKEALALKLGAHRYLDSSAVNVAQELQKLGGAKVILATAPSAGAMNSVLPGLGVDGALLIVAVPHEPLSIPVGLLIGGRKSVRGWASGTPRDSEDTLNFSVLHGIRPMIETYPLADVRAAYQRMMTAHARFRAVLTM
jgi:D-arabinose 1-dehydrogenase-like Zn-dependent alcohol dehydrogenase